jgi:threonylcarbamoyladenosine tRNA methylthiotransferase MtaB
VGKFFVQNFGCRATQADGAAWNRRSRHAGWKHAGERRAADLVVLNTCTVTVSADEDVRQTIRRVHRENPAARILVTGCYAQRAPHELARLPGVEWVVGNSHKNAIPELIAIEPSGVPYHGNVHAGDIHVGDIFAQQAFLSAPVEDAGGDRTRPNLKIQDGCNNRCSFCIIPFVRGRSRGMPADEVVAQVGRLAARHREVVLTGINLGRWGREPGSALRLAGLLRRLLDETSIERLRLSSVEPMDFSDDLLELMASSSRIAPHVHAPLQSGSDRILRRMHRKYRPRHYAERILKARRLMPDAAIGADVMVGFPGETDADFEESRQLHRPVAVHLPARVHLLGAARYAGGGGPADGSDDVAQGTQSRVAGTGRAEELRVPPSRMVGRTLSAVTLHEPGAALTGNYLKVQLAWLREANLMADLRIGGLTKDGLREAEPLSA